MSILPNELLLNTALNLDPNSLNNLCLALKCNDSDWEYIYRRRFGPYSNKDKNISPKWNYLIKDAGLKPYTLSVEYKNQRKVNSLIRELETQDVDYKESYTENGLPIITFTLYGLLDSYKNIFRIIGNNYLVVDGEDNLIDSLSDEFAYLGIDDFQEYELYDYFDDYIIDKAAELAFGSIDYSTGQDYYY